MIPDGCCDFIVEQDRGGDARSFVSDLSDAAYQVKIAAGSSFFGVRLKPGAVIEQDALSGSLMRNAPQDLLVGDRVAELCRCHWRTDFDQESVRVRYVGCCLCLAYIRGFKCVLVEGGGGRNIFDT